MEDMSKDVIEEMSRDNKRHVERCKMYISTKCSYRSCLYINYYKNEVGCRDDTMPKTGDTRWHCEIGLTACNNLPRNPQKTRCREGDCGRLLHTFDSTLPSCVTCFGTVSSLHPTSFLYLFN